MTDIRRIPLKRYSYLNEFKNREIDELIKEFNNSKVLYSNGKFQYECKICKFTFFSASRHAIVLHIGMKHEPDAEWFVGSRGFKNE